MPFINDTPDMALRDAVWRQAYRDAVEGTCLCCTKPVTKQDFAVGNMVKDRTGALGIDNKVILCIQCSVKIGDWGIVRYMKDRRPGRYSPNYDYCLNCFNMKSGGKKCLKHYL